MRTSEFGRTNAFTGSAGGKKGPSSVTSSFQSPLKDMKIALKMIKYLHCKVHME
jgi:hypothetical protein